MFKANSGIYDFKLLPKLLAGHSDKKAISLTIGFYLSLFPIFGTTTILGILISIIFKLNQYIVLTLNIILSPLQLLLIYPFLKTGRLLFFKNKSVLPDLSLNHWLTIDNWDNFIYMFESAFGGIIIWAIFAVCTGFFMYKILNKLNVK